MPYDTCLLFRVHHLVSQYHSRCFVHIVLTITGVVSVQPGCFPAAVSTILNFGRFSSAPSSRSHSGSGSANIRDRYSAT